MGLYTATWGLAFMAGTPLGAWVFAHYGPDILWRGVDAIGAMTCAFFVAISLWESRH